MPFNEALFWFGLTAFATGLYYLWDPAVKRLHSVGLTVLGTAACAYTVYRHSHPELPAIHLWVILLVLTWAFLGYNVYLHQFQRPQKEVQWLTDEIARTKQETADQIARLNTQHESEEYKSRQSRDEALAELRASRPIRAEEDIKQIKLAGVLESKAGHAEWLADELEKVWMEYNNQGKKLIRPLGVNTLPDPVKEWHEKRLWEFRVQYRTYVYAVRFHLPTDFDDTIVSPKAESRPIEYLDLKKELKEHANRLRVLAQSLLQNTISEKENR